ncbi:integrase [Thermococcus atlanticus]
MYWWARGDSNPGPPPCKGQLNRQTANLTSDIPKYAAVRDEFVRYLHERLSRDVARDYIRYLDKYVGQADIKNPTDLRGILTKVDNGKSGRWNFFVRSIRALIRFELERGMISEDFAASLLKLLKERPDGIDVRLPSDEEVRQALTKVEREEMLIVGLLCLFSGIRIKEAIKLVNTFDKTKLHIDSNIAYYELGWRRGGKISYYVFMPVELARRLRRFKITYDAVGSYYVKRGLPLKYARKWFINKMIEAGVQESVVKFMVGHSQSGDILATHYINLFNQAKRAYKNNVDRLVATLGDLPQVKGLKGHL